MSPATQNLARQYFTYYVFKDTISKKYCQAKESTGSVSAFPQRKKAAEVVTGPVTSSAVHF